MSRKTTLQLATATALAALTLGTSIAEAAGVLSIGRREDSTTFDPIATAQNIDFWVFMNVFDVLVRVDKTGTKLEPGLAESWTISDDGLTYTMTLRDAKFSDGSPITAEDVIYSLTRLRDDELSLWSDGYKIIESMDGPDDRTVVITLSSPSAPFLSTLAMPGASIISKAGMEEMGEEAYAADPVASGAFTVADWIRGDRVILEKNPNFWQADRVQLDGVEWISIPDDNTRMLNVQAGQIDAAIFVPFSRVEQLQQDPELTVHLEPSTREDALLINHANEPLGNKEVRQALDFAINKQEVIDAVTFGIGEVANSYVPKGALYYYPDNLLRPHDPEKAKALLEEAGVSDLSLDYLVKAGDEVDEQIAVLLQRQLSEAGVEVNIQKVDASQQWDMVVDGQFDLAVGYWTNDILDPDQKTTFVLGNDTNMNYMTRYDAPEVAQMVADARIEMDAGKREEMYVELQKQAKKDVNWIDLYYSPFINVSRKNIENFYQNPLGRFFLEDTVKN
ncbi:MAG: ABC transporter substrate-binding protein [Aurantimonas endophytica]|uniref:ABC transporter substrate-binding protein n=1 Tax=Aurantimonas endophytica TaxID=1522175 RepID=UPI003002308B